MTQAAKAAIEAAGLTGAHFDNVDVSKSVQFETDRPEQLLPQFAWLKVDGKPERDDFGVADNARLMVSERALELFQKLGIPNAEVRGVRE